MCKRLFQAFIIKKAKKCETVDIKENGKHDKQIGRTCFIKTEPLQAMILISRAVPKKAATILV